MFSIWLFEWRSGAKISVVEFLLLDFIIRTAGRSSRDKKHIITIDFAPDFLRVKMVAENWDAWGKLDYFVLSDLLRVKIDAKRVKRLTSGDSRSIVCLWIARWFCVHYHYGVRENWTFDQIYAKIKTIQNLQLTSSVSTFRLALDPKTQAKTFNRLPFHGVSAPASHSNTIQKCA